MATGTLQTDMGAIDVSIEAGEDLTAAQYHGVIRDAAHGLLMLADSNEKCLGILQNAPDEGEVGQVRISGVSLAKINNGAGVTFGNLLTPTATGDLEICDAAGEEYIAKALGAYADDDLAEVLVMHGEVNASDA